MNTNFENYKTFYFVAKYGNITAAAEALYSEQPNVTRAIKNLERDLGCVLFTRSNKGVTLTPEGEKLYRRVSIAYEQITAAEEELSRYNGFEEGILRIGVSETALHEVLLSALCKFHSLYPKIKFNLINLTNKKMNTSKVYFTNLRTTPSSNLLDKMERLVKRAGIANIDFKNQFVAIKIHFGEPGNLAYIRPNYAARLVSLLRELGAKPFLTDCNTLYSGRRSNAVDHLQSAMENGFNPMSAGCNVIIADGVKGTDYREIEIDGQYCKAPKIGAAIADADIIISMNHFKGHEQAGFGGALKNLGMGCASVGGKLELHCASQPRIDTEACKGCNICVKHCAHDAIHLNNNRKAEIDYERCVGCGQCVALCQYDGAVMGEGDTSERLNYKIDEYTKAVLADKPHFHVSFIMNVSPECDCWNHNDAAIIPDLGIAASFDPVALDKACADMVINAPIIGGNKLAETHPHEHLEGEDKFHLIHPDTNWQAGLRYAEEIGLGSQAYELITV